MVQRKKANRKMESSHLNLPKVVRVS